MIAALVVCVMSEGGFACHEFRANVEAARCAHAVIEWEHATRFILAEELGAENVLSVVGRCLPIERDA